MRLFFEFRLFGTQLVDKLGLTRFFFY